MTNRPQGMLVSRRGLKIDVADMARGIIDGKRGMLSRAITLVESSHPKHQEKAYQLFETLSNADFKEKTDAAQKKRFRLGITGPPGAGKSTFIASLGMLLLNRGHKVAVLAIDPSSTRTGGSILGDKTRMHDLSLEENAYIRPSPSGGHLGGIAQATAESASLCEAAGFDMTIIETVGVGQSETAVSEMVDMVLLLMPPAAGDDIQGMKKGIVELADLLVVNKADGELQAKARHTQSDYRHALQLLRPKYPFWSPKVLRCSSLPPTNKERGVDDSIAAVWDTVGEFREALEASHTIEMIRKTQREQMMWREIESQVRWLADNSTDPFLLSELKQVHIALGENRLAPRHAARRVLKALLKAGTVL